MFSLSLAIFPLKCIVILSAIAQVYCAKASNSVGFELRETLKHYSKPGPDPERDLKILRERLSGQTSRLYSNEYLIRKLLTRSGLTGDFAVREKKKGLSSRDLHTNRASSESAQYKNANTYACVFLDAFNLIGARLLTDKTGKTAFSLRNQNELRWSSSH